MDCSCNAWIAAVTRKDDSSLGEAGSRCSRHGSRPAGNPAARWRGRQPASWRCPPPSARPLALIAPRRCRCAPPPARRRPAGNNGRLCKGAANRAAYLRSMAAAGASDLAVRVVTVGVERVLPATAHDISPAHRPPAVPLECDPAAAWQEHHKSICKSICKSSSDARQEARVVVVLLVVDSARRREHVLDLLCPRRIFSRLLRHLCRVKAIAGPGGGLASAQRWRAVPQGLRMTLTRRAGEESASACFFNTE